MTGFVSVEHVSKSFGDKRAVQNITFTVNKGDVLGVLGPNGAGKTTTMRMITGALRPDSGAVSACGTYIAKDRRAAARHIGYLPEGVPLYPELSPRKFLAFFGRARGLHGAALQKRLDYVRTQLGLADVFDQAIDTLSKGYKRRVGFAQAILHDPKVLILDEPTDGLDPLQKHEVRVLIKDLADEKAIIISTHILEEVEAVCNRAVIVARGALLFDDTPETLINKHPHAGAVKLTVAARDAEKAKTALEAEEDLTVKAAVNEPEDSDIRTLYIKGKESHAALTRTLEAIEKAGAEIYGISVEKGSYDEVFRDIVERGSRTGIVPKEKKDGDSAEETLQAA